MPKVKYERISDDPEVQKFYERLVAKGESPRLAEVLATRKCGGLVTDDTFMKGRRTGNQFADNPAMGNWLAKKLRAAGGSPTGKVYLSALAKRPGDPEAWVSSRGDVERLVRKRGWSCEGSVNVKACRDNFDPGPGIEVANDIVEDRLKRAARIDPSIVSTKKKRENARAEIREKLKRKKD